MTTSEKLKPVPMAGQGNGSASLERIVGKLSPTLKKYELYLRAVVYYREVWSTTGVYPVDEAKDYLDRLRGDTPKEEIRKVLDIQLNKICEALPVPNSSEIDQESIKRALVQHGEVRRDEAQEIYLGKQ